MNKKSLTRNIVLAAFTLVLLIMMLLPFFYDGEWNFIKISTVYISEGLAAHIAYPTLLFWILDLVLLVSQVLIVLSLFNVIKSEKIGKIFRQVSHVVGILLLICSSMAAYIFYAGSTLSILGRLLCVLLTIGLSIAFLVVAKKDRRALKETTNNQQ